MKKKRYERPQNQTNACGDQKKIASWNCIKGINNNVTTTKRFPITKHITK